MTPLWNFGPVDPGWLFNTFCGRSPTRGECIWTDREVNVGTAGSLMINRPWDARKGLLVIYACCHGAQLLHWLNRYGPPDLATFNVAWVSNYKFREAVQPDFAPARWGVLRRASRLVYHPAYIGSLFDPERFGVNTKVSFHSPSFEPLWAVSEYYGEWPVLGMIAEGLTLAEAQECWRLRKMETYLGQRVELARRRLARKDAAVQVKIADFFWTHYQTTRLFLTTSHPAFPLIGYIGQRVCQELFGTPLDEAGASLLPSNPLGLDSWPDCWYARHHEALRPFGYPPEYGTNYEAHYESLIARIYDRINNRYRHSHP